jgi:hypothetical protein
VTGKKVMRLVMGLKRSRDVAQNHEGRDEEDYSPGFAGESRAEGAKIDGAFGCRKGSRSAVVLSPMW